MENFVPEIARNRGVVAPQAALEVSFRPLNPGRIKLTSTALPGGRPRINPPRLGGGGGEDTSANRRTELFRPGRATPVASKTEAPQAAASILEYDATPADLRAPGNWICRVTNLEDSPLTFNCMAEYPGQAVLKSLVIKLGTNMQPGFNQFLQDVVRKLGIKIHLESGKFVFVYLDGTTKETGQCVIDFAEDAKNELGLKPVRFEIPWSGLARIIDVNSQLIEISLQGGTPKFPGGFVQLVVRFEEAGQEIQGKFGAHLKNIVLTLKLGLSVVEEKLALGKVELLFPVKVDPVGFNSNAADIFLDVDKIIRRVIECILKMVDEPLGEAVPKQPPPQTIRQVANNLFSKGLLFFLGKGQRVRSVVADSQSITINYF
jgi:hypothetical protein